MTAVPNPCGLACHLAILPTMSSDATSPVCGLVGSLSIVSCKPLLVYNSAHDPGVRKYHGGGATNSLLKPSQEPLRQSSI
jgi:hypothetical protein